MKNKSILFSMIGLAFVVLLVLFFGKKTKPETDKDIQARGEHEEEAEEAVVLTDDQIQAAGIGFVTAGPGDLEIEISLPGEIKLNADNVSHIVPRFGGAITQLRKNLGDRVRKGDVLAVIESNESLATYEIKALNSGTIIQKHATVGEVIPENTEVFVVADLESVWVDLNVFSKDLPYVREKQKATIEGPTKDLVATGIIHYVGPVVSEHTRTAVARVILPNKDGLWRPGMFVNAKVTSGKTPVGLKIPKNAIQNVEGKDSVFVRTDKGFVAKAIQKGRADSTNLEILDGLQSGDVIVAEGAFLLKAEKGKSEAEHDH